MASEKLDQPSLPNSNYNYAASALLVTSLAAFAMLRRGNYKIALLFYPKSGGGGINIHQLQNGDLKRRFAIDYHPFWNNATKQKEWHLHYHRGEKFSDIKKHRPYEGGW